MSEDEAFSVLDVLHMNFPYFFGCTPNSHLLNSLFIWIEIKLFGLDQTAVRLHSAFSYLVFSWAVYRLSLQFKEGYLRYLFVVLITLHPYLIEYFSLARGYAMSFACMMMSLYFLYEYLLIEDTSTKKKLYWAVCWAGLAVLSSYVLLTFYIAVLLLYAIHSFFMNRTEGFLKSIVLKCKEEVFFWTVNAVFLIAVMAIVLRINPTSLAAFWPGNSFWSDTIYSIVEMFFIGTNVFTKWIFSFLVLLLSGACVVSLVRFVRSRKYESSSLFALLFLAMYGLFVIQYYFFAINYVSYRGAIYLYPFICIVVFFWVAKDTTLPGLLRKPVLVVLVLLGFFVVGNFINTFSLSRGIDTAPKAAFEKALQDLDQLTPEGKTVSLGVSRAFPATMEYYRLRYGFDWIRNIGYGYEGVIGLRGFYHESFNAGIYDYFIIEEMELKNVEAFQKVKILKRYPDSPMLLLQSVE